MKTYCCQRKLLYTLICIVALALCLCRPAMAATVHVSTAQELKTALSSASGGDTIVLDTDIEYDTNALGAIDISEAVTLDGAGHTISTAAHAFASENELVNSPTMPSYTMDAVFNVPSGGDFTLKDLGFKSNDISYVNSRGRTVNVYVAVLGTAEGDVHVSGGNFDSSAFLGDQEGAAVTIGGSTIKTSNDTFYSAYSGTVSVTDSTIVSDSYIFYCSEDDAMTINVSDSSLTTEYAVFDAENDIITVSNCSIQSGEYVFDIDTCTVTVSDSTLTSEYETFNSDYDSIITVSNCGIQSEESIFYGYASTVTVSDSTLISGEETIEVNDNYSITITNCEIQSEDAVFYGYDSSVTISDSTMTSGRETFESHSSSISVSNCGIQSDSDIFYVTNSSVTVSGGTYSADASVFYTDQSNKILLNDGVFNSNFENDLQKFWPVLYLSSGSQADVITVAPGYAAVPNDLTAVSYAEIVKISSEVHSTQELQAAINAGCPEITMLEPYNANSYDVSAPIECKTPVVVNGGGYTLKRTSFCTDAMIINYGKSLTLNDLTIDGANVEANMPAITSAAEFDNEIVLNKVTVQNCVNLSDEDDLISNGYIPGGAIGLFPRVWYPDYSKQNNSRLTYSNHLFISDSVLKNNRAASGGAIYICQGDEFSVTDTVISGNSAARAGGGICAMGIMASFSDTLYTLNSLKGVTIEENYAPQGGGMFYSAAGLVSEDTVIRNNRAVEGGGLWDGPTMDNNAYSGTDSRFYRSYEGISFYGNKATTDLSVSDITQFNGTGEGDDIFCGGYNTSGGFTYLYRFSSTQESEKSGLISRESRANETVPFKDAAGNDEPIPDEILIPFDGWYFDDEDVAPGRPLKDRPFLLRKGFPSIAWINHGTVEVTAGRGNVVKVSELMTGMRYSPETREPVEDEDYLYVSSYWNNRSFSDGLKAVYHGYLVKYMPNHPEINNGDVQQYDMTAYSKGDMVTVWNNITNEEHTAFTNVGRTFLGWNTEADGSGETLSDSFQITENTILYAQWGPPIIPVITPDIAPPGYEPYPLPPTGDNSNIALWLALLLAGVFAESMILLRKKKNI